MDDYRQYREKVDAYVREHGGQRPLCRILIASNGIAAVKCIRSLRRFAYETWGADEATQFVVMATPEDVAAGAEYIHMADQLRTLPVAILSVHSRDVPTVEVPGGSNVNNYANVRLIVQLAIRSHSDAVWPGWGHASENPELAEALLAANITWIGPGPEAMRALGDPVRNRMSIRCAETALGDKIASHLIAQAAGVPCLPWSGSEILLQYKQGEPIPSELFRSACATTCEEATRFAEMIGFPIMIKASEGGGGKGIRRCDSLADVPAAFTAVQAEVRCCFNALGSQQASRPPD